MKRPTWRSRAIPEHAQPQAKGGDMAIIGMMWVFAVILTVEGIRGRWRRDP